MGILICFYVALLNGLCTILVFELSLRLRLDQLCDLAFYRLLVQTRKAFYLFLSELYTNVLALPDHLALC